MYETEGRARVDSIDGTVKSQQAKVMDLEQSKRVMTSVTMACNKGTGFTCLYHIFDTKLDIGIGPGLRMIQLHRR